MRRLWRTTLWPALGAVPLGVKIMGIVVFPMLIMGGAALLYVRNEILDLARPAPIYDDLYTLLTPRLALILGALTAVGIALALGLSYVLVRPLRQLLTVIRRVEGGNLSARVSVWAPDEIGQVQGAFNRMTGELEQSLNTLARRNDELAGLDVLSEWIALNQDLDRVLEAALDRIMGLLESDAGSLYLLEPDGAYLRQRVVRGQLSEALTTATRRLDIDDTPMRQALLQQRPVALDDVSAAPELPAETAAALREAGFAAWAAAPLLARGQVIGAISLARRANRPFGADDLRLLGVVGNVIGTGVANAQLVGDLRRTETELRWALQKSVQAQEEERRRLARELHDEAGQALTAILIRLQTLQTESDPETVTSRIEGLRLLTMQTLDDLRRLSMDLRPAALDSLGLLPTLRWYIDECARGADLSITFYSPDDLERLPTEIEVALYRIAQEALTNAIRHSGARTIDVLLERQPRAMWLTIADDGRGFDPAAAGQNGLGLIGIRERVGALNGTLTLETGPGAGTRLAVQIPLEEVPL